MMTLRHALHRVRSTFTEGRGDLITTALLHPVELATARDLLPHGLELRPGPAGPRLLLLLSHCRFTTWFGEMAYREVLLAVPDVAAPGAPPSLYFRRLYLDQTLPRVLGNLIYGWEKSPARITWEGHDPAVSGLDGIPAASTYRVACASGDEILTANLRARAEPPPPALVTALFEVLAQPVISQAARRLRPDAARSRGGPFLFTHLHIARPSEQRTHMVDLRLGPGFDPPALAGLTIEGATAMLACTTQVVSLPARAPGAT